ncbi:hypothetical protein A2U01_0094820, partial [Trifolium medium]|nr:hypothetical protein [Trifolium medium]
KAASGAASLASGAGGAASGAMQEGKVQFCWLLAAHCNTLTCHYP